MLKLMILSVAHTNIYTISRQNSFASNRIYIFFFFVSNQPITLSIRKKDLLRICIFHFLLHLFITLLLLKRILISKTVILNIILWFTIIISAVCCSLNKINTFLLVSFRNFDFFFGLFSANLHI